MSKQGKLPFNSDIVYVSDWRGVICIGLFYVNLTQAGGIWEEGLSTGKMSP